MVMLISALGCNALLLGAFLISFGVGFCRARVDTASGRGYVFPEVCLCSRNSPELNSSLENLLDILFIFLLATFSCFNGCGMCICSIFKQMFLQHGFCQKLLEWCSGATSLFGHLRL